MNNTHDGGSTDLRAHPDVFIPRDYRYENSDESHFNANDTRTRSNSGGIYESTSSIISNHQPTLLSQSYGGDRSSFFLLRQSDLPNASRIHRHRTVGDHTIPGMSNIAYSGYLYKRSNHPHRNPGEVHDQKRSIYDIDPTSVPELPVMPGISPSSDVATADGSSLCLQQSLLDVRSRQHDNATIAVTPSPANVILNTEMADSVEATNLNQQSAFSPPRLDRKKTDGKNPIQLGLELGAAFFGIELKKNECDEEYSDDVRHLQSSHFRERNSLPVASNYKERSSRSHVYKEIQAGVSTTTVHPEKSSSQVEGFSSYGNIAVTPRTARLPIPTTNSGSSSHQDQNLSLFREPLHGRQPASNILSESPSSSKLFDSESSSSKNTADNAGIPQDFYDPEDGHLWRAKYCVLEEGILYFYKHATDGNSAEAAAERKKMLLDDFHNDDDVSSGAFNDDYVKSNNRETIINKSLSITGSLSAFNRSGGMKSRRRSSAKDLSKSPMVRPDLHPLASGILSTDIDSYMWEKRVFMDCVGGVRTAEQQYGQNAFELLAMDDDESDQNLINTLVLKGQNSTEMKEWIFQFHRSLASFMRNFIDVVGSAPPSGRALLENHSRNSMLSSSHSTRHLSSSSLVEPGSIPQSSSEKHLHRLISTSPSMQQTLSHGHGRTTLKRRMDIRRAPSESASLSSTPDTGDLDYGHHPFAFREPSPNNIGLSPESTSPPMRVLIPPPVQSYFPTSNKVDFESMTPARVMSPSLGSSSRSSELPAKVSTTSEIHRPMASTTSGKYIPPHLRSKSKYIPPHLRRQQGQESQVVSVDSNSIPTNANKNSITNDETQEGYPSQSPLALDRSQFSPIKIPTEQYIVNEKQNEAPDVLDIINPSTPGFVRGGCADPQLVEGSILDQVYIPKKASRLKKSAAEAYGSYGGSYSDNSEKNKSSLRWEIGAISECGIRESNEDAYLIANDLLNAFETSSYGTPPQTVWTQENTNHSIGLFGIFDGHCGNQGARFAVERLGRFIHDELRFESIEDAKFGMNTEATFLSPHKLESILREAIVKMDVAFCNLCQEDGREWESGATALVALLANENLVIASLGDCRGFLCRFVDNSETYVSNDSWEQLEIDTSESSSQREPFQNCFWKEVTTVHSPSADEERLRIENANGWITTETEIPMGQLRRMDFHDEDVIGILKRCLHYPSSSASFTDSERSTKECKAAPQRIIHISRVCGELAVSRALGDRDFKADFNCISAQRSVTDGYETKEGSSLGDALPWESPLFLPYPENHSRQFQGDLVTNIPDFHHIRLGIEGVSNEFLLFACDGLWDVMDADDAIRVVRDLLFHKKVTAKKAAARLAELAIHLGSSDNITVLLIRLFSRDDAEQ